MKYPVELTVKEVIDLAHTLYCKNGHEEMEAGVSYFEKNLGKGLTLCYDRQLEWLFSKQVFEKAGYKVKTEIREESRGNGEPYVPFTTYTSYEIEIL